MALFVERDVAPGVTVLRLDRPPVNALDLPLTQELQALATTLAGNPAEHGALVLTGRVGMFSAGLDLKAIDEGDDAHREALMEAVNELALRWYRFPRPVVTAVAGHAIAGGLLLALCGDVRIGPFDPGARFGLPAVKVGIRYPEGPLTVLRSELGSVGARRLMLAGQTVGATTLHGWGLLDELVPPGEVLARAIEVAAGLAALPPEGYAATKAGLRGDP